MKWIIIIIIVIGFQFVFFFWVEDKTDGCRIAWERKENLNSFLLQNFWNNTKSAIDNVIKAHESNNGANKPNS